MSVRFSTRLALILPLLLMAASVAGAEPLGEWGFLTSYMSGDYGTDTSVKTSSAMLRYAVGDAFQFRVSVPAIGMDVAYGVVNTGAGTVPVGGEGERRRRERGGGNGSGGSNGHGNHDDEVEPLPDGDWTRGLGDIRMALSRRIVGGGVRLFRLDGELEVKLPTADEEKNLGTGKTDFRLGVTGEYRFWSSTMYGGAGWNRLGDPWWGDLNDILDLYLGIEGDPMAGERIILSGWVAAQQESVDGTGERADLAASLRTTGKFRFYGQVLLGLGEASPDLGVMAGISFGRVSNSRFRRGGL